MQKRTAEKIALIKESIKQGMTTSAAIKKHKLSAATYYNNVGKKKPKVVDVPYQEQDDKKLALIMGTADQIASVLKGL